MKFTTIIDLQIRDENFQYRLLYCSLQWRLSDKNVSAVIFKLQSSSLSQPWLCLIGNLELMSEMMTIYPQKEAHWGIPTQVVNMPSKQVGLSKSKREERYHILPQLRAILDFGVKTPESCYK